MRSQNVHFLTFSREINYLDKTAKKIFREKLWKNALNILSKINPKFAKIGFLKKYEKSKENYLHFLHFLFELLKRPCFSLFITLPLLVFFDFLQYQIFDLGTYFQAQWYSQCISMIESEIHQNSGYVTLYIDYFVQNLL